MSSAEAVSQCAKYCANLSVNGVYSIGRQPSVVVSLCFELEGISVGIEMEVNRCSTVCNKSGVQNQLIVDSLTELYYART